MKVPWTFITESNHFTNGLEGRKTYWVVVWHNDGTHTVEISGTDKWGDFPDNDDFKENANWPRRVVAFSPVEVPELPDASELAEVV